MKCEHIRAPIDFSRDAEQALGYAIGLARQFQARLTLLHAIYVPEAAEVNLAAYLEKVESEAEREIAACRKRAEDAGVAVDTLIVRGVPSHTIVGKARDRQVDLIAMGTHGRTGLQHLLIGSVAERVVRLAPCPVMVIPREAKKD